MVHPRIIAIDGPAASGKSTLGEKLARYLGYLFFDTGVMYRAVTWAVLMAGIHIKDESRVTDMAERIKINVSLPSVMDGRKCDISVNGEDVSWEIRSAEVDKNVSPVSAYKGVRRAMTEAQRRIVKEILDQNSLTDQSLQGTQDKRTRLGGIVMVGRDIGTVVVPDAELKIFLIASISERAKRRYLEVQGIDPDASYEEIYQSMLRRDMIDSTRSIAPLKPADDAKIIDTDEKDIKEVFSEVVRLVE